MYMIVGNFDIFDAESQQWPICDDNGCVHLFSSINDAHEYMKHRYAGKVHDFNRQTAIAGVGGFTAPSEYGEATEGCYYVLRAKCSVSG